MLRQRPGIRMPAALALSVALFAAAPPSAHAALPDSVVARLPHRDLTVREMKATWQRLDARYRPDGTGLARNRAFLDQLIEKEVMARAALAEPFVMAPQESAQYAAYAKKLAQEELFALLVTDSTRVTDADRDSARAHLDSLAAASADQPGALDAAALPWAQRRRGGEVEAHIRADLAPAWDDSAAARLARGYLAVNPALPSLNQPMRASLPDRRPPLAPGDSARVLVGSSLGPLTVGEFVRRFQLLNPFQTELPTSPGAVKARAEQFLGQMWFDHEVVRRNIPARPRVATAVAERRESIALDHWYERHVKAAIDTSTAALEAHYKADPEPYAVPAHYVISHAPFSAPGIADSVLRAYAAGAPWDSVCARASSNGAELQSCTTTVSILDDAPDSALVARLGALKPNEAYVRVEEATGTYRVVRLVEHVGRRVRPFAEARDFVARNLAGKQAETILAARMGALVKATPVTVNQRALSRLTLEP